MIIYIYFIVSLVIFFISSIGLFLSKQNLIIIPITIELILLSINPSFVLFSCLFDDFIGILFFFFIPTLAGAEVSLGLSIPIIFYRVRGLISIFLLSNIKG